MTRRAARLGCDLSRGAIALVAEIHSSRPGHAAALVASTHSGAVAELLSESPPPRVYAVLPAPEAPEPADAALDSAGSLLLRALAGEPEEVHRFYEDTVQPRVAHDARYRTDLLATLEAYLASDYNMNATARAIFAHRHTVAHRLGRIKELTGLDPGMGEDRERLGLGVKAYRILAPTLPG